MRRPAILPFLTVTCVLSGLVGAAPSSAAELRQTDDYLALIFEAEDHDSADDRWVLTRPDTPQQEQDPDGNHSDQAVGNAYLELLPDVRVTHDDPFGPPLGFWGRGGDGPVASYTIDFPEPGRYFVHVRSFSTGTEDNGVHVGLNGDWPKSGSRVQFCTAADRAWRWSSNQRGTEETGSCGRAHTIWLTVEEAGEHVVQISPREDGFEIDRVMLIKDLSDNTRICRALTTEPDTIKCRNGSLVLADEQVDVAVELNATPEAGVLGDQFEIVASVSNRDGADTATDLELAIDFDTDHWTLTALDERCEEAESGALCQLESLPPSPADTAEEFAVTLTAKVEGTPDIEATVSAEEIDDDESNDSAQLAIDVQPAVELALLAVDISDAGLNLTPGESFTLDFTVNNSGPVTAAETTLAIRLPTQLTADLLPETCSIAGEGIDCEFDELDVGAEQLVTLAIIGAAEGLYSVSALVRASNSSGDESAVLLELVEPAPVSEPDPGTDSGSGSSDGQTSGSVVDEPAVPASGGDGEDPDDETPDATDAGDEKDAGQERVSTSASGGGALGVLSGLALLLSGLFRQVAGPLAERSGVSGRMTVRGVDHAR